jgi:hypothetical protein
MTAIGNLMHDTAHNMFITHMICSNSIETLEKNEQLTPEQKQNIVKYLKQVKQEMLNLKSSLDSFYKTHKDKFNE